MFLVVVSVNRSGKGSYQVTFCAIVVRKELVSHHCGGELHYYPGDMIAQMEWVLIIISSGLRI